MLRGTLLERYSGALLLPRNRFSSLRMEVGSHWRMWLVWRIPLCCSFLPVVIGLGEVSSRSAEQSTIALFLRGKAWLP